MTIYEIKARTKETSPYFFSRRTLKFFGQTMKSFKVRKLNDHEYFIFAPSYSNGKIIGYTKRIFDTRNNKLKMTSLFSIEELQRI
jgi:hypothetical protein